jgi:hypothetical protein
MSEVLFDMPERHEDYDSGWRRESYSMSWSLYNPPVYTVCDEGGNHDHIDEEDMESAQARREEAWKEYGEYVAHTGLDPLYEYLVRRTYKRKVRYTVELRNGIGGAIICRWRRGTRGKWTYDLPDKTLADAFHCYDDWTKDNPDGSISRRPLKDIDPQTGKRTYFRVDELEEFADGAPSFTVTVPRGMSRWPALRFRWFHIDLEETVDRAPAAIARDLKRLAKKRGE